MCTAHGLERVGYSRYWTALTVHLCLMSMPLQEDGICTSKNTETTLKNLFFLSYLFCNKLYATVNVEASLKLFFFKRCDSDMVHPHFFYGKNNRKVKEKLMEGGKKSNFMAFSHFTNHGWCCYTYTCPYLWHSVSPHRGNNAIHNIVLSIFVYYFGHKNAQGSFFISEGQNHGQSQDSGFVYNIDT